MSTLPQTQEGLSLIYGDDSLPAVGSGPYSVYEGLGYHRSYSHVPIHTFMNQQMVKQSGYLLNLHATMPLL